MVCRNLVRAALGVVLFAFFFVPVMGYAATWPVWQGNNARTAAIEGELGVQEPGLAWSRFVGGGGQVELWDFDGDQSLELFSLEGGGPIVWNLAGVLQWDREPLGFAECSAIARFDGHASGLDLLCVGVETVAILDGRTGISLWTLPSGLVEKVGRTWYGGPPGDPHLMVADFATGNAGDGAVHLFRLTESTTVPQSTASGEARDYKSGATVSVGLDDEGVPTELVVLGHAAIYVYRATDGLLVQTLEYPDKVPFGQAHMYLDPTDQSATPDLILIRDYNRGGEHYNSVSRIARTDTAIEEVKRVEWPEATEQICPRFPLLDDGRVVTSIREPSGWSVVTVDTEGGTELERLQDLNLIDVFAGPTGTPHILARDVSTGSGDKTSPTWLKRGGEAIRNLGPRTLVSGSLFSEAGSGIGRLSSTLVAEGILPLAVYQKPNPVPVGVEILELNTLDLQKEIFPNSAVNQVVIAGKTESKLIFSEISGALRLHDLQGNVLNPVTVNGDPAPRQGNYLPRWAHFGRDEAGSGVLVVEAPNHARLAFLGENQAPASILYARRPIPTALGKGGKPSVFGAYNFIWDPDMGATLVFAQANGNKVWTSPFPEFSAPPNFAQPVLEDFDNDGIDDLVWLIYDKASSFVRLFLISGADGSRMGEPLLFNAMNSSLRGLTLLRGDKPRLMVNIYNTIFVAEVEDGALVFGDAVVPGHTMGALIVLPESTESGVSVILGGTYQGMQGLNESLESLWKFSYPSLHGPGIAVPDTPSGPVAVATPRKGPILLGVDVDTGSLRWSQGYVQGKSYSAEHETVLDSSYRLGSITSSVSVDGSFIYVGSSDGYVYAVDAETGALKFSISLGSRVGSVVPVDVDGDGALELLAEVGNGSVIAIDNAELPGPVEVAELPLGDSGASGISDDIDIQESAESLRVAFEAVEGALNYEVRLLSGNGNPIGLPKITNKTDVTFENLGLALETFLVARVRTQGEEAYSAPTQSDGIIIRDMSPPEIGEVYVDGVENDGLVPRAPSVLFAVDMEDKTRLGEISLRVTISRDGTQLAKAVEYVGRPERKLTIKVPLGDLAIDEQIRVEAEAADLAGRAVVRTWVLRIVDPDPLEEEEEIEVEKEMPTAEDVRSSSDTLDQGSEDVDEEKSSGGSSSCSLSGRHGPRASYGYWLVFLFLCYMLWSFRGRNQLGRVSGRKKEFRGDV